MSILHIKCIKYVKYLKYVENVQNMLNTSKKLKVFFNKILKSYIFLKLFWNVKYYMWNRSNSYNTWKIEKWQF